MPTSKVRRTVTKPDFTLVKTYLPSQTPKRGNNMHPVRKITIVGGGTSGWMAAATLAHHYREHDLQIQLVESDQIGTIGVGEATVPGIIRLNQYLGIKETDFIAATGATFKLGIEFADWHTPGESFFHPFADFGAPIAGLPFFPCWLKLHKMGRAAPLQQYCLSATLAKNNRFAQPDDGLTNPLALYSYAYHFDASRYALFLRKYAEERGVKRTEGKVVHVSQDPDSGYITQLTLENSQTVDGDLFIDCSGFRGLLIEETLNTGYESWQSWLPCDRALAVQSKRSSDPRPYTQASAHEAGWRWNIPLQHRSGNGYVYSSAHIDDDRARTTLMEHIDGEPVNEPRLIQFTAGMRNQFWNKNCVALGLASGFIEPLESTSISLIQTGVEKLVQHLPNLEMEQKNVDAANRLNRQEYERLRDFIIMHYKLNGREDSEFWRHVRTMEIPDTLKAKLDAFAHDGRMLMYEQESFNEPSWLAIYNGLHYRPQHYLPDVDKLDTDQLTQVLEKMHKAITAAIVHAPQHGEFLQQLAADAPQAV